MKIEVFGAGCSRCVRTEKIIQDTLKELKVSAEVEKVRDVAKIVEAGIMSTPAVSVNGKIVSTGRIPGPEDVKKWIQQADT